jgi:hypothetical protein
MSTVGAAVSGPYCLAMGEKWPSLTLSKRPIELLMRSLLEGNAELDGKIEESAVVHPDFFIFESLAGAGAVLAPRL